MKVREFVKDDWVWERSSGYAGYRNTKTGDWIYERQFQNIFFAQRQYEKDLKLLSDFRWSLMNQYIPDFKLIEFLDEKYKSEGLELDTEHKECANGTNGISG